MKSSLIVLLAAGLVLTAGPAFAKTSIVKGEQICEAAAKAQTPAPKSVRADGDATKVSDSTLTYKLKVRTAADVGAIVTCKVDRETGTPTLTPVS